MKVGIGYSDNPDSALAGEQVAEAALAQGKGSGPCDLVLLFNTTRHNQAVLRKAVAGKVGGTTPIFGGGAAGVITNDYFGYAGDQVGAVCIWLEGSSCNVISEGGLADSERETGLVLGRRMKDLQVKSESPLLLFYDAINPTEDGGRLIMATPLLKGLEQGLGFLPDLAGAGMQGSHSLLPSKQYVGDRIAERQAIALAFSEDIRMDTVIIHGCKPASPYYRITKAEGPVILEINGEGALQFMDKLLSPSIKPEDYPFFLTLGVNHGERWGEFDENNYANRLCLAIDKERGGIVMFEPDMAEGVEFQIMFRSMDFDYMKPRIESLFDDLQGGEPLFALYIDCAGRCAGYSGIDMEDAVALQRAVNGRAPLLGLYTGVEIASIGGRPRGLDWTGVFCLFSRNGGISKERSFKTWGNAASKSGGQKAPQEALVALIERNAAKILAQDNQSIAIRHELELKRRGFNLLAELSVSLRHTGGYENVFVPVARRINAALNMQKTAALIPGRDGNFIPSVLQGYSVQEKALLAGLHITIPPAMMDPEKITLVTSADPPELYAKLRETLFLPYFIAVPALAQNKVAAMLITGRMTESAPFFSRLGQGDVETLQAIGALLSSALERQLLDEAEERTRIMLDTLPLCCVFWDETGALIDCNDAALRLFATADKKEFLETFYRLSPEFQPDGNSSVETRKALLRNAFLTGRAQYEWFYCNAKGDIIPSEVTLTRVRWGENYVMAGYIRDLREQKAASAELRRALDLIEKSGRIKNEFLAAISHEVRTPLNAIMAMAREASEMKLKGKRKTLFEQGARSARLLNSSIDSILDFSRMEAGEMVLEEKSFSVREMTCGIAAMLRESAAEKGLSLRVEAAEDLPEKAVGDGRRLEQALFNIAANGVKFTDQGEVVIRISHEATEVPEKTRFFFEVRDTGKGMTEAEIKRAFLPFESADSSYRRREGGMGMGLAVSLSIAQLMDGDLNCESVSGQGSVFTLSAVLSIPKIAPNEKRLPIETYELEGLRCLVAEDNPINSMIIEEALNAAGITVTMVANGIDALGALEGGSFDMILLDIQMPEMDGLTAASQIRRDSRFDKAPILAMTANSAAEHREESLRAGFDDHLTKPIDVEELYAALKRWDPRKR